MIRNFINFENFGVKFLKSNLSTLLINRSQNPKHLSPDSPYKEDYKDRAIEAVIRSNLELID